MKKHVTFGLFLAIALPAWSTTDSSQGATGLWKKVNEQNGQIEAIIRVADKGGELTGKIEKIYAKSGEEMHVCEDCPGELKGKILENLVVMSGMRQQGDEFGGGTILDPETGTLYSASLKLVDDGKHMHVRGFVGNPLLGKTHVFERMVMAENTPKQSTPAPEVITSNPQKANSSSGAHKASATKKAKLHTSSPAKRNQRRNQPSAK